MWHRPDTKRPQKTKGNGAISQNFPGSLRWRIGDLNSRKSFFVLGIVESSDDLLRKRAASTPDGAS